MSALCGAKCPQWVVTSRGPAAARNARSTPIAGYGAVPSDGRVAAVFGAIPDAVDAVCPRLRHFAVQPQLARTGMPTRSFWGNRILHRAEVTRFGFAGPQPTSNCT